MNATKCSKCGFVGFPDGEACKRCHSPLDFTRSDLWMPAQNSEHRGSRAKVTAAVLLVISAIVAFIVIVPAKLTKYFDKTPQYISAISSFEKFREPVTVRVNRVELPNQGNSFFAPTEKKPASLVKAAEVLEAAGLLQTSVETTVRTVKVGRTIGSFYHDPFTGVTSIEPSEDILRDVKTDTVIITLTEKGRQEAANWKEVDEPYENRGSETLPWWRIPIGEREILRVESVTPGPNESGNETEMVSFRWRWRPNNLGASFDLSNLAFNALPPNAQAAVKELGHNSQTEAFGQATLRKQYGRWECVDIIFPSELILR